MNPYLERFETLLGELKSVKGIVIDAAEIADTTPKTSKRSLDFGKKLGLPDDVVDFYAHVDSVDIKWHHEAYPNQDASRPNVLWLLKGHVSIVSLDDVEAPIRDIKLDVWKTLPERLERFSFRGPGFLFERGTYRGIHFEDRGPTGADPRRLVPLRVDMDGFTRAMCKAKGIPRWPLLLSDPAFTTESLTLATRVFGAP